MVKRAPCLMVWMNILMMRMCCPCEHIFKLSGLLLSFNAFIFNSLSPWYTFMFKPPALYMLVTMWSSWMILSAILDIKFLLWGRWSWMTLYVGKAWSSHKNLCIVRCSCDVAIFLLEEELLAPFWIGFCGVSCHLVVVVWRVHICDRL